MRLIKRGPNGKFLPYGGALAAWLPVLLDNGCLHSNILDELMLLLVKWCDKLAASRYLEAANALTYGSGDSEASAKQFSVAAEKWFQRKAVLAEARSKLRAL